MSERKCNCEKGCSGTAGSAIEPDGDLCELCEAHGCRSKRD